MGVRSDWHPRSQLWTSRPAADPAYRDREISRFYQARGLSPEQTWQVLSRELARVLADARTAFWRRPLLIDVERVR